MYGADPDGAVHIFHAWSSCTISREEEPQLGAVARLRRSARLPPHPRHARRLLPARPQRAGGGVDEQGGGGAHPQLPQPATAADLPAAQCHNACRCGDRRSVRADGAAAPEPTRAERRLPAGRDGDHEQAADQLLLQDASSPLWCDECVALGSVPFLLHHGFWVCCCQ